MKNVLLQAAIKLNTNRKKRKWWQASVRVVAAIVVFVTTYALILPAITVESDPICGLEAHTHAENCYIYSSRTAILCGQGGAHSHNSFCYDEAGAMICSLPESQAHAHAETCYATTQTVLCQDASEEHVHADTCMGTETVLTCGLEELTEHNHSESCRGQVTDSTLICTLEEHTHDETCYPVKEESGAVAVPEPSSEYLCGIGVHAHGAECLDETGNLTCTIPEHAHEAACIVADLDMGADWESESLWEKAASQLTFTGDWAQDVLIVAESQIGYTESRRNMVLEGEMLKGYTRYGDWGGLPYGDWCAMFVSFCIHYADVDGFPYECEVNRWIEDLTAAQMYGKAGEYEPKPGDVIFFDFDKETEEEIPGGADHVGLVAEIIPATDTEPALMKTIEGNTGNQVAYVTYVLPDPNILGYGILPQNPLSQEEWAVSNQVAALVAQLPDAEETQEGLDSLNRQGDKPGFEALRQEVISRIEAILVSYEGFNELQKARVGSLDNLYALQEICGGASWQALPVLTDDSAVVSALNAGTAEVIAGPKQAEYSEMAANNRTRSIHNGDTICYPFTVSMESYFSDVNFSEGRVKVELVLPVASSKAVMDTAAMDWLDDSVLTFEYRTINEDEVLCQVLTGYKQVISDENTGKVISGTFTEEVIVNIKNMAHGERIAVIISAAMEHGTWEGLCEAHDIEEKLSIVTETFLLYDPLPAEQQQAIFEDYLAQINALAELEGEVQTEELERNIHDSYCAGALSDDHYGDLYQKLLALSGLDLNSIAEPSKGNGWIWLDVVTTSYSSSEIVLAASAKTAEIPIEAAMPVALSTSLGLDSNSQIPDDGWGGENSQGDMIWVSKTIEGTEQENVFDITLQVITKEEVNEVYKEPDMAVVIVMDISNTMVSVFSGEETVTRYDAAMDSAEQFMKSFAEATDGVSKLGYVAFNTHGHEVFPMQECSTTAQATSLANTMRTKTKSIMDTAAAKESNGKYSSSHERFTNIEAGLAMAADMLEDVDNSHKYIIFLSDGFPTTYMTASSTDGYKGYDPYTTSGTNGNNGVFYDGIMGVHCDYGTSYSDTAAIKARQKAVSLKKEGINIFSIGVDVEGQNIWEYHWDSQLRLKTASTVERRQDADYYNSNGYEIGTLHSEITKYTTTFSSATNSINLSKLPASAKSAMSDDFKKWLEGTKTSGIGSGFYYDSTDEEDLKEAYSQIFAKILELNAESSKLDWVATDPMPGMGVHELETIEFIGFWDMWNDNPTLVDALSGESLDNSLYYNTATFNDTSKTISWDLKDSGYQSISAGNNRNFMCALRYRVRLMNEEDGFVEKAIYDTNDVTSLTYRIIEVKNNETQISNQKSINFPIPKVFGYLSELNFLKVAPSGNPIPGAKFALTHDTANCGTCRGDGEGHVTLPVYEAVSGKDGVVSFTRIPSGHHYTLTETEAPEGYVITNNTYHVEVSYDALTVKVTDADGNPLEWTGSVENDMHYILPYTGGTGTFSYTFGGLLMIAAAACGYVIYTGRKRQKGGSRA